MIKNSYFTMNSLISFNASEKFRMKKCPNVFLYLLHKAFRKNNSNKSVLISANHYIKDSISYAKLNFNEQRF